MSEITINRKIPQPIPDSLPALDAALRQAVPTCTGLSYRKEMIVVHVEGSTAEDEETVRRIVLAHDFSTRTDEQQQASARAAERETFFSTPVTKDNLVEQIEQLKAELRAIREG